MQFSFLENRSLVPRKFQVVENHCSNMSCAEKFYQYTFSAFVQVCTQIHTPSFAIRRVCQMLNSSDTFIKLKKKVVGETTRHGLKKLRHQCIPTNKQWWFRRIVSKHSASSPFTVFTMAMVKVCILSSVSLCIRGSRTKWRGAGIEHGAQISSF